MIAVALAAVLMTTDVAQPQPLPHLRLIAPAAPGGGWDQTARAMQPVLQAAGIVSTSSVENIPGAGGTIGLARFISAERGSGDVLLLSGLIMLGAVLTNHSPVTLRDVTPIARLTGEFDVVVVPTGSPYQSFADLMAAFRQHPEAVSWAGGSAGGADQILAWLIADAVGVEPRRLNYVPYAGGGEALSAILGGQVSVGISGLEGLAPHIEAGTIRVLAVSSGERLPTLDAPTLREQGVDIELENWRSLVAPPGISAADRARLLAAVDAMVRSPAWRDTLVRYRWSDRYLAGDDFAAFMRAEEARVQEILTKLGTTDAGAPASVGRYPLFVLSGLAITGVLFVVSLVRQRADDDSARSTPFTPVTWRGVLFVAAAIAVDLLFVDRAGFVLASTALFWLTARAFDASRPLRDAVLAFVFSLLAYLVFARLLQVSLPPGVLGAWW